MLIKEIMADGVDTEWLALISEAKELGLTQELVREFLHRNEVKEVLIHNG
ncbi:DNA-binding anti-repressor SinI [Neobacillus sp. K501]